MVPTTSLVQDLNFTINDLIQAQTPEDTALVTDVRRTIGALVERLKPVLHYIARPLGKGHAVEIAQMGSGSSYRLGISKNGEFGWIRKDSEGTQFEERADAVDAITVKDIFDGLQAALKDAEDRRNQHTAAVSKRRELLGQIQQLISNAA